MNAKLSLTGLLLAGVLSAGGCERGGQQVSGTPAAEGYVARSDYSLIPDEGLAVMDRELARREEQIVSGLGHRDDGKAGESELARIRAERSAIAEAMGRR